MHILSTVRRKVGLQKMTSVISKWQIISMRQHTFMAPVTEQAVGLSKYARGAHMLSLNEP